jgi:hypothetical protein
LTNTPNHRATDQQRERRAQLRIDEYHRDSTRLVEQKRGLAAEAVSGDAKQPDPDCHAEHRDGRPDAGAGQRVAERLRQVSWQPDHQAVVTEVLHRAENGDAKARAGRAGVGDEQLHGRLAHAARNPLGEQFRLLDAPPHEKRQHGWQQPDSEHPAPADQRQQQRRQQRCGEHAQLPAEPDIRRHPCALRGRPCLGDERHADAELAAQPDARNRPVREQIAVALRERTQAGENRKDQDRPRHQRPGLRRRKVKIGGDDRQAA